MAARMGLDRRAVVRAAIDVVDHEGVEALSMSRLAATLGIRGPSLYAHVRSQAELRRELWLWVVDDLGEHLRTSVMGRSGADALVAFATAMRDYARTRPGRYQLTLEAPSPFDDEAVAARRRANSAFDAVIRSFGLSGDAAVHVGRALRAAIHGFVGLESRDALGERGVDESWDYLLVLLAAGLDRARDQLPPVALPA